MVLEDAESTFGEDISINFLEWSCLVGIRQDEIIDLLDNCQYGNYKFLYLSPERLQNDWILERIKNLPIHLIAIDEAHCVSQWGHDFRPDYIALAQLKQHFPHVPLMALTATADPATQQDIRTQLKLVQPYTSISSFDRPNIRYTVQEKFRPFEQLVALLKQQENQSGIVYCSSRKKVDELYGQLKSKGFAVGAYHAGLSNEARSQVQDAFKRDHLQLIVATVAFGMGVNKPNIRFVVHFDLPPVAVQIKSGSHVSRLLDGCLG